MSVQAAAHAAERIEPSDLNALFQGRKAWFAKGCLDSEGFELWQAHGGIVVARKDAAEADLFFGDDAGDASVRRVRDKLDTDESPLWVVRTQWVLDSVLAASLRRLSRYLLPPLEYRPSPVAAYVEHRDLQYRIARKMKAREAARPEFQIAAAALAAAAGQGTEVEVVEGVPGVLSTTAGAVPLVRSKKKRAQGMEGGAPVPDLPPPLPAYYFRTRAVTKKRAHGLLENLPFPRPRNLHLLAVLGPEELAKARGEEEDPVRLGPRPVGGNAEAQRAPRRNRGRKRRKPMRVPQGDSTEEEGGEGEEDETSQSEGEQQGEQSPPKKQKRRETNESETDADEEEEEDEDEEMEEEQEEEESLEELFERAQAGASSSSSLVNMMSRGANYLAMMKRIMGERQLRKHLKSQIE